MTKAAKDTRTIDQVKRAALVMGVILLTASLLTASLPSPSPAMSGLAGAHVMSSSVEIGRGITFKKYQLARMLDQVFTLATDMKQSVSYETRQDEHGQIAIIQ